MARQADSERVVAFYNRRGTCEQWIKEGKGAIKWTRLSSRTFAANAVRLQLLRSPIISAIFWAHSRHVRASGDAPAASSSTEPAAAPVAPSGTEPAAPATAG